MKPLLSPAETAKLEILKIKGIQRMNDEELRGYQKLQEKALECLKMRMRW